MDFKSRAWIQGIAAEKAFAKLFTKVQRSTREQDMFEHWDLAVKFDIKSVTKDSREGCLYCVELKNVKGEPGWLAGKADFIAFDTPHNHWIVVSREALLQHIKKKLQHIMSYKKQYCLYSRKGRKDLMTFVPYEDLKQLGGVIEK